MTTEKIPAQDTPAPKDPPQYPPVPRPGPSAEGLPAPQKTPSIKPPRTTAEIIGRTIADCFFGGLAYFAARNHVMSGDMFTLIIITLCGIRMSDIATIRKSGGNGDPPIAGGLTGGILALLSPIADLFRPHG